jgi:hypothetical protein
MKALVPLLLSSVVAAETPPQVVEVTSGSEQAEYGVGLRARYISVPKWYLNAFTDESVPLSSAAFGGEFTLRRGPDFDWVFGVEYAFASPPDGNWLGNGKDAGSKTDYVHFDNFGLVSIDAMAMWNKRFSRWFTLTYGAGLGVAIPTGKLIRASSAKNGVQDADCDPDHLDTASCHPPGCGADGVCTDAELAAMEANPKDGQSDPEAPAAAYESSDIPPVLPVIQAMIGARFTLSRHFEVRVEGGFHDYLFVGSTGQYLF